MRGRLVSAFAGIQVSIFVLFLASSRAEAGCIDPATLAPSAVSITRYFDDKEKEARPGVLGASGTGWFLSPSSMVTVEHVTAAMNLSDRSWKQVEIWTGENKQSVAVRVRSLVGSYAEKIAVLELQTAFSNAPGFRPRAEPLLPEEPVISLAYPDEHLRVATGRFVRYGDGDRFAGMALLDMYDGNDRLVLDYGSSERLCSIAQAEWSRSSASCSYRPYISCHKRYGSPRPGEVPTWFRCPLGR
jgi:hypothetical protein